MAPRAEYEIIERLRRMTKGVIYYDPYHAHLSLVIFCCTVHECTVEQHTAIQ